MGCHDLVNVVGAGRLDVGFRLRHFDAVKVLDQGKVSKGILVLFGQPQTGTNDVTNLNGC